MCPGLFPHKPLWYIITWTLKSRPALVECHTPVTVLLVLTGGSREVVGLAWGRWDDVVTCCVLIDTRGLKFYFTLTSLQL